ASVPSKFKIKYFKLKDYPATNPANNSNWDTDLSGPDVYFSYGISGIGFNQTPDPYLNVSKDILPLQLTIDNVIANVGPNITQANFSALDYDSPSNSDVITSVSFNPIESTPNGSVYYNGSTQINSIYPEIIYNN